MDDEETIVREYIKWANKNSIPISECTVEDIEAYMMRRATAAG